MPRGSWQPAPLTHSSLHFQPSPSTGAFVFSPASQTRAPLRHFPEAALRAVSWQNFLAPQVRCLRPLFLRPGELRAAFAGGRRGGRAPGGNRGAKTAASVRQHGRTWLLTPPALATPDLRHNCSLQLALDCLSLVASHQRRFMFFSVARDAGCPHGAAWQCAPIFFPIVRCYSVARSAGLG